MTFDKMFNSDRPLPTFDNAADRFEWQYNRILDGMITIMDRWAQLSMAVEDGDLTMDELKREYDIFMAEKTIIALMLDEIRKRRAAANADKLVEDFRKELNLAPETDEPNYDL